MCTCFFDKETIIFDKITASTNLEKFRVLANTGWQFYIINIFNQSVWNYALFLRTKMCTCLFEMENNLFEIIMAFSNLEIFGL